MFTIFWKINGVTSYIFYGNYLVALIWYKLTRGYNLKSSFNSYNGTLQVNFGMAYNIVTNKLRLYEISKYSSNRELIVVINNNNLMNYTALLMYFDYLFLREIIIKYLNNWVVKVFNT